MQGEHLNIMCQVQSVYYSLGKQTSKEKQFETAAFFFFSPGTFDLIPQQRSHRTWLPSSSGRRLPVALARPYISGVLVSCLLLETWVLFPREELLVRGDRDQPSPLFLF